MTADTITVDDETVYVARVGRQVLAWPERGPLVGQITTVAESLFDADRDVMDRRYPRSVQAAFADHLEETGEADREVVRQSLRAQAKQHLRSLVAPDTASRDRVDAVLEQEYPPEIVAEAREELRRYGDISATSEEYHSHGQNDRATTDDRGRRWLIPLRFARQQTRR